MKQLVFALLCLVLIACNTRSIVGFKDEVGEELPPPDDDLMCTLAAPECQSIVIPPVDLVDPNSFEGAVGACTPQVMMCAEEPVIGMPCGSGSTCEDISEGQAVRFASGCNILIPTDIAKVSFDDANINCSYLKYTVAKDGFLEFTDTKLENVELVINAGLGSTLRIVGSELSNVDIRIIGSTEVTIDNSDFDNVRVLATDETVMTITRSELRGSNVFSHTFDLRNTLVSESFLSGKTLLSLGVDYEASRIEAEDVNIDLGTIQDLVVGSMLAEISVPSIEQLHMHRCGEATFLRSNLSKSFVTSCRKLTLVGSRVDDSIIGSATLIRTDIRGSIVYAGRVFRGSLTATSSSIAASALCGITTLQAEATEFDCFSCDVGGFVNERTDAVRIKGSSCDALGDT